MTAGDTRGPKDNARFCHLLIYIGYCSVHIQPTKLVWAGPLRIKVCLSLSIQVTLVGAFHHATVPNDETLVG